MELHLSQKPDFISRPANAYVLCGWRTKSEIALTNIPTTAWPGDAEIRIEFRSGRSPVTSNGERIVVEHLPERSLIGIERVADFEIRAGQQIYVWPAAEAATKDIEIFLFGPAWATLCHQRGLLPLHTSAVVTGRGITAIAGHSGAGKSSTAAWLAKMGYELVADDILPISLDRTSVPGAWPYLRRLKLHHDLVAQLGWVQGDPVSERFDKNKCFVSPKKSAEDRWSKLDRVYLLGPEQTDSQVKIDQITGADAVQALVDQTYHYNFIRDTRRFGAHLDFCARLASQIAIYRVYRPLSGDIGKTTSSAIRDHLEVAAISRDREL